MVFSEIRFVNKNPQYCTADVTEACGNLSWFLLNIKRAAAIAQGKRKYTIPS